MGCAGALQASLLQRGLRGFFAGVEERGVEAAEEEVDVADLVGFESWVGELARRVEGGSRERVVPELSEREATVADGSSGWELRRRRALLSTVVSAFRKSTRFETVCVGRMLSLMAIGLLAAVGTSPVGEGSLLPSAMTTVIEMLSALGSWLAALAGTEFD